MLTPSAMRARRSPQATGLHGEYEKPPAKSDGGFSDVGVFTCASRANSCHEALQRIALARVAHAHHLQHLQLSACRWPRGRFGHAAGADLSTMR